MVANGKTHCHICDKLNMISRVTLTEPHRASVVERPTVGKRVNSRRCCWSIGSIGEIVQPIKILPDFGAKGAAQPSSKSAAVAGSADVSL